MSDANPGPGQPPSPVTTGVFAILTAKAGVTRDQIMAIMPAEIRATVQLYLQGRIRDWYTRADGRGAVFLLNVATVAEAEALMEEQPLAREHLIDHAYVAVGPLMPLRLLLAAPATAEPA
jgi:hypothetical protein